MRFGVHGVCLALAWFDMDLHIADGLLGSYLTSFGCLLDIPPWGVEDLLTTCDLLHDGHMYYGVGLLT